MTETFGLTDQVMYLCTCVHAEKDFYCATKKQKQQPTDRPFVTLFRICRVLCREAVSINFSLQNRLVVVQIFFPEVQRILRVALIMKKFQRNRNSNSTELIKMQYNTTREAIKVTTIYGHTQKCTSKSKIKILLFLFSKTE